MKKAVDSQKDGIAIAAPQIGAIAVHLCRIRHSHARSDPKFKGTQRHLVFINPKILKLSKKMQDAEEGCLSVRWKYGWVMRAEKATISALGEDGKPFERGASGILAQVFQHETDHLDGKLLSTKLATSATCRRKKHIKKS